MCRVLSISRSSYYSWKKSPISNLNKRKDQMKYAIQRVYFQAKGRYGSPRITQELKEEGINVSRKTVAKYMQQMGIKSKLSRKYKVTTNSSHKESVSENILNREFAAKAAGEKCVSDITYLPTCEGFLYLTTIIDLFDRKVIGWSISDEMTTQKTVIAALVKAVNNRVLNEGMIFHSDRGIQYASKATVNFLSACKFIQSMSRKGNCWDNAVAESFFKSIKTELIYGHKLRTKEQMRIDVFEYLEIWYNKKRRHSYLQYLTIPEFWNKYETHKMNINPAA